MKKFLKFIHPLVILAFFCWGLLNDPGCYSAMLDFNNGVNQDAVYVGFFIAIIVLCFTWFCINFYNDVILVLYRRIGSRSAK